MDEIRISLLNITNLMSVRNNVQSYSAFMFSEFLLYFMQFYSALKFFLDLYTAFCLLIFARFSNYKDLNTFSYFS